MDLLGDNICPKCGLKYADMRTGETFQSIKDTLWVNSDDPKDWKYKRRGTVLGRWYMLKRNLWEEHLANCGNNKNYDEVCRIEEY